MINNLTDRTCIEDQAAYDTEIRQQHTDMDSLIHILKGQQTEMVRMTEELKGLISPAMEQLTIGAVNH